MSAAILERPKKRMPKRLVNSVRSTSPSPDETGTTTPAGIAANDPDAEAAEGWTQIRPRLRNLMHMPQGTIEPTDHVLACHLEPKAIVTPREFDQAVQLVAKYFPGESFVPVPVEVQAEAAAKQNGKGLKQIKGEANGAPAAKPAKREVRDFGGPTLSKVTWAHCVPHPDNDPSREDEIDSLAESLKTETMLEKPVVRPIGSNKQGTIWQIISGHRRIAAARKLGWKEGDAHVIQCDNARALELLAIYNAKRQDLTPIAKAKMIERLCQPIDKGGSGFTREQAGKVYDLESGAAASNLVRLLELPKVWQDRVASGELPWTWARELLPVVKLKPVMAALDEDWKQRGTMQWADEDTFLNRENVIQGVKHHLGEECRRLDEMHFANGQHRRLTLDAANPAVREQLGIVEVQIPGGRKGKSETVAVATNVAAFDEMLKQQTAKANKSAAAKAGAEDKPAKRELTPTQRKALAKKQSEELARRIDGWRHAWLKSRIAVELSEDEQLREWILVAIAAQEIRPRSDTHEAIEAVAKQGACRLHSDAFQTLGKLAESDAIYDAGTELARQALLEPDSDPRYPAIPFRQVDQLAAKAGINLAAEWAALQAHTGSEEDRTRYETFFELHQTAQLDSLGNELGVHVVHVSGKAAKIKLLTSCMRTLKLPKSIKPVAGVAKKAGSVKATKGRKA